MRGGNSEPAEAWRVRREHPSGQEGWPPARSSGGPARLLTWYDSSKDVAWKRSCAAGCGHGNPRSDGVCEECRTLPGALRGPGPVRCPRQQGAVPGSWSRTSTWHIVVDGQLRQSQPGHLWPHPHPQGCVQELAEMSHTSQQTPLKVVFGNHMSYNHGVFQGKKTSTEDWKDPRETIAAAHVH